MNITLAPQQIFGAEIYFELDTSICAITDFSFGVCLINLTLFFGNIANVDNMSEPARINGQAGTLMLLCEVLL